jgi:hypothetical protein
MSLYERGVVDLELMMIMMLMVVKNNDSHRDDDDTKYLKLAVKIGGLLVCGSFIVNVLFSFYIVLYSILIKLCNQ